MTLARADNKVDGEIWSVLLGNALVLACALWNAWPVALLVWPFWMQSVVVGLLAARRVLALRRFGTSGLKWYGLYVAEVPEAKRRAVRIFLLQYGVFHLACLAFVIPMAPIPAGEGWSVLVGGAVFAIAQILAQRAALARDALGKPDLGTVMAMTHVRVLPMVLVILLGIAAGRDSPIALGLFMALKTATELGMLRIERVIATRACADAAPHTPRPHDG
ncbi:MAG: hypothetical protein J0L88_09740 [Xanthomonadales bacterium]|nr:hypothetical protein [Xanthomonadales bacterium]